MWRNAMEAGAQITIAQRGVHTFNPLQALGAHQRKLTLATSQRFGREWLETDICDILRSATELLHPPQMFARRSARSALKRSPVAFAGLCPDGIACFTCSPSAPRVRRRNGPPDHFRAMGSPVSDACPALRAFGAQTLPRSVCRALPGPRLTPAAPPTCRDHAARSRCGGCRCRGPRHRRGRR